MDAQTAEEEEALRKWAKSNINKKQSAVKRRLQEWNPLEILEYCIQKVPLTQSVFQKRERDVARTWEHNSARKPYLEAMHIPAVNLHGES